MSEPTAEAEDAIASAPAPEPIPAPTFVGGGARSEVVMLDWPLEYAGKLYDRVTVSRPSLADLEGWSVRLKEMRASGLSTENERIPMFDAPLEVLSALDPDDDDRVTEVANRFLPRRFQGE